MIGICKPSGRVQIRLYSAYSLIFFGCILLACQSPNDDRIRIQWQGKRATSLLLPHRFAEGIALDSLSDLLTVRLAGQAVGMAGQFQPTDSGLLFEPLVPFTRGLRYAVWRGNKPLHELTIPALAANDKPALLGIYPSADSLPANLLKLYLRFSRPMREGQSARYVALLNAHRDTLRDVFLDLQPELWNAERTQLTLWLDPGRIKRDLLPNQRLGAPLKIGQAYQLVISPNWPDALGATLGTATTKSFQAVGRDSLMPDPVHWRFSSPPPQTRQPLTITFGESLDYSLLTETISIFRADGSTLMGTWQLARNESQSQFTPSVPWQPGRYRLRVENRLEDLAGNNLIRPFDRDITRRQRTINPSPFRDVFFEVRK